MTGLGMGKDGHATKDWHLPPPADLALGFRLVGLTVIATAGGTVSLCARDPKLLRNRALWTRR